MKPIRKYINFIFLLLLLCFCVTADSIMEFKRNSFTSYAQDSIVSKELVLLWEPNVSEESKYDILSSYNTTLQVLEEFDNYMLCKINTNNTEAMLHTLRNQKEITAVDYNEEIMLFATEDPFYGSQWAIENTGTYFQQTQTGQILQNSTPGIDLDLAKAWKVYNKKNSSTREVTVAIVDTGVDYQHPDLKDQMWINTGEIPGDSIDNDNNGYVDDIYGWDYYNNDNTICHYDTKTMTASKEDNDDHGTHCAGIIAATANNNVGIAGVASNINVKIMSLKIHGGTNGKGSVANAIKAIKYATMMGADICNLSWGSTNYNEALEQTIKESSMLFIAAAGNSGSDNDTVPVYPASLPLDNIISVTFVNPNGSLTVKSNYGATSVDIAAPGVDILSTVVGNYRASSGSSMAAPHVSGIAAILYSSTSSLYASNVKELLLRNYKPLTNLTYSTFYPGIPSAMACVESMDLLKSDTKAPSISVTSEYEKDSLVASVQAKDKGSSGIRIISYLAGKRTLDEFKHGTIGTTIIDGKVSLAKAGWYTFYVSDYSGNEVILPYEIADDNQAPSITASYKTSINHNAITITAAIEDTKSGVKSLKYLPGTKTVDDFLSGKEGTPLKLTHNTATIQVTAPGPYTIYASDYRGNKTVYVIDCKVTPITGLTLSEETKTLSVGSVSRLDINVTPRVNTDQIYYYSSNPSVASVSQWGLIHGKANGHATIYVQTSSGLTKKCRVIVQKE